MPFPQNWEHFRFRFWIVVLALVFLSLTSPTQQVSWPRNCIEVVVPALKNTWNVTDLLDAKLINNFADCMQEMYKINKEIDWKAIGGWAAKLVRKEKHKRTA